MTQEKFLTVSKSILCLSIAVSALIVVPYIINSQLTSIRKDVKVEVQDTRKELVALTDRRFNGLQTTATGWFNLANVRLASLEKNTFSLAKGLRKDTFALAGDLRKDSVGLADTIQKNSFAQIGSIATKLDGQLTTINTNVGNVTTAYAGLPATIGARFNNQTDCVHNGICWQNMITDTLRDFRYASLDVSTSSKAFSAGFPKIITNVDTTTANFSAITLNFKKLTTPHWYDRALGYGLNAGILYSRFNPVVAPVTVIQAVSSQK